MVANFTPEESLLRMTRLTSQSLFYQGKEGLKHKLLTIEEDEGMREALYSIRTLLSSQRLSVQSLKTDPKTGEFRAYGNVAEGPASVMISTTNISDFDHETLNRFFTLFLDESREQTKAILAQQKLLAGPEKLRVKVNRKRLQLLHGNVQRMLQPVMVLNRIGTGIEYPEEILNTRRETSKTESLIETYTLLHQYQREIKTERVYGIDLQYIEVTQADIDAVHAIAGPILQQSLDELPKLCRDLLLIIHELANEKYKELQALNNRERLERWQVSFTRKEIKDRSGWSLWHIKEHLRCLDDSGYITPRAGKKGQRYAYSLVEDIIPALPNVKRTI
jgi:hypothetical protein